MNETSNFTIECLGEKEEWVYDIEVEDNHNFFANDILVHNSVYFQLGDVAEKAWSCKDNVSMSDKVDILDKFCEKILKKQIDTYLDVVTGTLNARQPELMVEDREAIGDAGVFIAKKRYFIRLRDNEGERFPEDEPYMKKMGIEIIKSSTPEFAKKHLNNAIPIILDGGISDVKTWLSDIKTKFTSDSIGNISKTTSVSKVDNPDWGRVIDGRKVTMPINSRAAVATNNFISSKNLDNKYMQIQGGDKIKLCYLKMPNPMSSNIMAFVDNKFAEDMRDYVDYDTIFDKFVMSPLEIMTSPLNWDLRKNTASLDDW